MGGGDRGLCDSSGCCALEVRFAHVGSAADSLQGVLLVVADHLDGDGELVGEVLGVGAAVFGGGVFAGEDEDSRGEVVCLVFVPVGAAVVAEVGVAEFVGEGAALLDQGCLLYTSRCV